LPSCQIRLLLILSATLAFEVPRMQNT
jgi:hypothetical protein